MIGHSLTIDDSDIARRQQQLSGFRRRVALTGAGISCASGLPLDNQQINGVALKMLFREEWLVRDPQRYYDAYRQMVTRWRAAAPNSAHAALANAGVPVVTQNIDGLHRDAGSQDLIELHGNLRELRCPTCEAVFQSQLALRMIIPRCPACASVLRPGYTLQGQEVRHFSRAVEWVASANLLLIIGTTLDSDPVRQLPQIAQRSGATVWRINEYAETIVPRLLRPDRPLHSHSRKG